MEGTWQIVKRWDAAIPPKWTLHSFFQDKIRDPATRFHRLDDPQAAAEKFLSY